VQPVNPLIYVPVGLVLSAAIGLLAYRRGSLSRSGVLGAVLTGTLHFGFGGLTWGLTLIAFFISSTLLGKFRAHEKESIARQYAKGGQRDFGQTLANGGAGAALAVAFALHPTTWLFAAFVGATATVNADTWATELGPLSRCSPRLLTTGRVVPPGTSGGVTMLGTAAALAGAMLIGFVLVSWRGDLRHFSVRAMWRHGCHSLVPLPASAARSQIACLARPFKRNIRIPQARSRSGRV